MDGIFKRPKTVEYSFELKVEWTEQESASFYRQFNEPYVEIMGDNWAACHSAANYRYDDEPAKGKNGYHRAMSTSESLEKADVNHWDLNVDVIYKMVRVG